MNLQKLVLGFAAVFAVATTDLPAQNTQHAAQHWPTSAKQNAASNGTSPTQNLQGRRDGARFGGRAGARGASTSMLANQARTTATATTQTAGLAKKSATNRYAFDVPSLVGKNLDQIIAVLGAPSPSDEPTELQIKIGIKEWDKIFVKDGKKIGIELEKQLLVTYTISSRKVVDFFIGSDDPTGQTKDTTHLLELANAKEHDPRYSVKFVKAINSTASGYTGIAITPN